MRSVRRGSVRSTTPFRSMRRGSVGGCFHENLILALALALSLSLSLAHPRTHAPTHPLTPHLIFLPPPTPLPPCPTSHLPHLQSQLTTPPALIAGRHRIVLDNRQADHSKGLITAIAPEIIILGWSPLSLPRRSRSQVCVFVWYLRVLCPSVGLSASLLSPTLRLLASPLHPERDARPQMF